MLLMDRALGTAWRCPTSVASRCGCAALAGDESRRRACRAALGAWHASGEDTAAPPALDRQTADRELDLLHGRGRATPQFDRGAAAVSLGAPLSATPGPVPPSCIATSTRSSSCGRAHRADRPGRRGARTSQSSTSGTCWPTSTCSPLAPAARLLDDRGALCGYRARGRQLRRHVARPAATAVLAQARLHPSRAEACSRWLRMLDRSRARPPGSRS